jgi:integrase
MRAAEVMHLSLDDVDWADGIIHIRGAKSRRDRDLPLLRDVNLPPQSPYTTSDFSSAVHRHLCKARHAFAGAHRHALAGRQIMNGEELRDLLIRYVEHRKLLGYRYTHGGVLTRFVQDHAIEHPGESIKAKEVLEWVTRVHRAPPTQVAILSALRGFLRFVKAIDPATSVPDNHLLPSPRRNPPYILNEEQLQSILHAAATARPKEGLRADAYVAVLGLLASSGLRVSEALHLKERDVHLRNEPPHVVLRETKFKSHAS